LTKDIQEIEKLVRNLNNSPTPPRIELDLALSKLRHAYELLSMIREDIVLAHIPEQGTPEHAIEPKAETIEHVVEQTKVPVEQVVEPVAEPIVEPVVQAQTEPVKQIIEQIEKPKPEPEPVVEKQAVQAEIPMEDLHAEPKGKKKEAEILAEKFSNDPSINENIASATKKSDITSKIAGTPIDNISRNIGINDRFLIIRELFEGDNDNYSQLITQLDSSGNVEEAISLLKTRFPNAADHEGYLLLTQLVKRKYITV